MKVFVGGNCQAVSITRCLQLMNPRLDVQRIPWGGDRPLPAIDDGVVLWQLPRIKRDPYGAVPENVVFWPVFYFNAFHPDITLLGVDGVQIPSPIGTYHSALAHYGWRRGLTVEQTLRLFAEPVCDRLGYLVDWDRARALLLEQTARTGADLRGALERWTRAGCFMHTMNHPKLFVMADVVRDLMRRAGIEAVFGRPEEHQLDPLQHFAGWPVYPEIAARIGIPGDHAFRVASPDPSAVPVLLDLERFVAESHAIYARYAPDTVRSIRPDERPYDAIDDLAGALAHGKRTAEVVPAATRPSATVAGASPYAGLPDERFWRRAVERIDPPAIDPAAGITLPIARGTRVASVGSCFAQHISRALARSGYDYLVTETPPAGMPPGAAQRANYGVFSARYGNIYTARALLQLIERAYGTFVPDDVAWPRADGRYVDPFRPEIEPDGYASAAEIAAARSEHFAAVRAMFERLDVLVFTLGQTEAWFARSDGAVFPLAPGVVAGTFDPRAYAFANASGAEVVADVDAFLRRLRAVNPRARVVLTVSPVPQIATYEPRHVLVSSAASKAILRAAADQLARAHGDVLYFPSYEIITASFSRGAYYGPDVRSVTAEGVEHVMRLFFAHCEPGAGTNGTSGTAHDTGVLAEVERNMDVVCDEDRIAFAGGSAPA